MTFFSKVPSTLFGIVSSPWSMKLVLSKKFLLKSHESLRVLVTESITEISKDFWLIKYVILTPRKYIFRKNSLYSFYRERSQKDPAIFFRISLIDHSCPLSNLDFITMFLKVYSWSTWYLNIFAFLKLELKKRIWLNAENSCMLYILSESEVNAVKKICVNFWFTQYKICANNTKW